jgi:hypothetical protein
MNTDWFLIVPLIFRNEKKSAQRLLALVTNHGIRFTITLTKY